MTEYDAGGVSAGVLTPRSPKPDLFGGKLPRLRRVLVAVLMGVGRA